MEQKKSVTLGSDLLGVIGNVDITKIKILAVPSNKTVVGKYRSIDPHKMLHKLFKDEFHVEINPTPDYEDEKYFNQFNIVHIHKSPTTEHSEGVDIIQRLKGWGCKVIIDVDEYWEVDSFNPNYQSMKHDKSNEHLRDIIVAADWITTSTPILEAEIRKYRQLVTVIPNSIDPTEPQFQLKPVKSDRIRIGYIGDSTQLDDIRLVDGIASRFTGEYIDKIQMVLAGFDIRGTTTRGMDNGKLKRQAMSPEESAWFDYEKILTANGRLLVKYSDYAKYLAKYTPDEYDPNNPEKEMNMPYRRLWVRDINNYARNYNNLDISLAPLVENKFNSCKSQLKVVEAGFFKKALVCQNFGAYQLDLINIFDGDKINPLGNAALVDSRKNHKQWSQYVKRLVDNPELIQLMGENLYKLVHERFDLRNVTKLRADLYRSLV